MARSQTPPPRLAPRIYLLVSAPADETARSVVTDALRAASGTLDIAALLVRLDAKVPPSSVLLRPVIAACHAGGIACLITGDVALADELGADGAHLDGIAALKTALPALRPHGIAGVGDLRTKHDAMTAGELGADYVMFGEPDAAGRRAPFETTVERTDWWAQLFEPPCVAYARTLEEVDALVEVGADFIAVDTLVLDAGADELKTLALRLGGSETAQ